MSLATQTTARRPDRCMYRQCGFTLLELLVAISVFAVLSLVAYGGLQVVLDSDAQLQQQASRLGELQRALTLMQRDIEQTVRRPVRDTLDDRRHAMIGDAGRPRFLELSRAGRPNPLGHKQSAVQRVGYRVDDGELYRLSWSRLDAVQDAAPRRQRLLGGVASVQLRFIDADHSARADWPPAAEDTPVDLPLAVEFSVQLDDWGFVRRLFRVAGAAPGASSSGTPTQGRAL